MITVEPELKDNGTNKEIPLALLPLENRNKKKQMQTLTTKVSS